MFKRKKLINKKFQLRTTFTVIGIIIITFILIIAVTGIISTDNTSKIKHSIAVLKTAIEREDKIILTLLKNKKSDPDYKPSPDQAFIIQDHSDTMKKINANIFILKDITYQNKILFLAMVIIGILLGIILYFYLIKLTHRVSGPIYVLTRHIEDIINGKEPDIRGLRKNDEFKEFYDQFVKMLDHFK